LKPSKERILGFLIESASERWGKSEFEELRPALTMMAEAIYKVEEFDLTVVDEPAPRIVLSKLAKEKSKRSLKKWSHMS